MPRPGKSKPDKRIMGGREKVKVACIQAPQLVFNKEKQIKIACDRIKEAGANGAELVAFSETYIPVFPAYYTGGYESDKEEWSLWNMGLWDNSIVIPSDDTDIIGQACKEAGVYCVMGVHEMSDEEASKTFYNTQIFFGKDGSIMGRHRKLMPTYTERTYWGNGDGSDLDVYKTDIGRIGGLICWEHHMLLVRVAQMLLGEEFHIANFPGTYSMWGKGERPNRTGIALSKNEEPYGFGCDNMVSIREYAFQSGCFVLCAQGLLRDQDFESGYEQIKTSDHFNYEWANGGSCIVNPFMEFIGGPVINEDTIVYADCYANEIKAAKIYFDGIGHYSRPDVVKLFLDKNHNVNLNLTDAIGNPVAVKEPDSQSLKQISEEYEIKLQRLEALTDKIMNSQK
ncbi:carbon-nitrogen hydrolase family protein [Pseudoramibacter faecis]|uniref:carbon-nitrogen hydrolase family protein n=1 Tax=Pseudoramibacter faecis TaxID=3108534 RepID=UPI002E77B6CE|nr:carbon-nitrogen hydrolase family protein [Pseudoramibacter sp. HA2172]